MRRRMSAFGTKRILIRRSALVAPTRTIRRALLLPPAGLACAVAGRGRFVPSGHSRCQQPRTRCNEDCAEKISDEVAGGTDLL